MKEEPDESVFKGQDNNKWEEKESAAAAGFYLRRILFILVGMVKERHEGRILWRTIDGPRLGGREERKELAKKHPRHHQESFSLTSEANILLTRRRRKTEKEQQMKENKRKESLNGLRSSK